MDNFLIQIKNIASKSTTNNIFILGKGSSIDDIDTSIFHNSFIIGINDSEKIANCDISIFHEKWAGEEIKNNGWKSKLYITTKECLPLPKSINYLTSPYEPCKQDNIDIMMSRLVNNKNQFQIEEILFLSALKISIIISNIRKNKQNVYMIGFDFSNNVQYSKKINIKNNNIEKYKTRIIPQEDYFKNALYMLKDSNINIKHIGYNSISELNPKELNLQISNQENKSIIKNDTKVLITAELTTNHFGDRLRLEKMVRLAKESGADLIKVQKRDVESFYTEEQLNAPYKSPFGKTFRDYRLALELKEEDFWFLDKLCKSLDIEWFASILDKKSFQFMMKFNPSMIKIPSTISTHKEYLNFIANNYTGIIVLSTGMTDLHFENWVIKNFTKCKKLYLMQCNSAYPTPIQDCNIGVVSHYKKLSEKYPKIIPGYSSHDYGWFASVLAVAAGAKIIEKHVKLGNTEWAHFDAVAVDLKGKEFLNFVSKIREAETAMGSTEKKINSSEHHKYLLGK